MKIKHMIIASLLLYSHEASAYDFSATVDGQVLFFEITNKVKKTAEVTYDGTMADKKRPEVKGTIKIPAKVKHEDTVYDITAIGRKAFANAEGLRGIIIPSGITTIGDFAFENCDSLSSVVFPGNPVKLGQGIFFNCTGIENITIGSDWKSIDLTMFRWSDMIKDISIPAKIEKVNGIKKLRKLQSISVDPNNTHFLSSDGILYTKDGSTLLACPRGREGKISIKDGTKTVSEGSLIDCTSISALFFPESLESISFHETSRMNHLEYVALKRESPIFTGYDNGRGKFFFQLLSPKTEIIVPASAKREYIEVLAKEAGEYSVTPDGIPYSVSSDNLPNIKNIKGVKNFDKY